MSCDNLNGRSPNSSVACERDHMLHTHNHFSVTLLRPRASKCSSLTFEVRLLLGRWPSSSTSSTSSSQPSLESSSSFRCDKINVRHSIVFQLWSAFCACIVHWPDKISDQELWRKTNHMAIKERPKTCGRYYFLNLFTTILVFQQSYHIHVHA